jgi:hypothetical protein
MYIYDTGALAFPQNADGSGQTFAGSSGYVLTTRGSTAPPQWVDPTNISGSLVVPRGTIAVTSDNANIIDTSFQTYLKFVFVGQGRYGLSGGGYDVYYWIQEWEWYYMPNATQGGLGTSELRLIRTIATNNSVSYGFWYSLSYNSSQNKIVITNTTSGRDPDNLQPVHYSASVTNKTPLVSPY